MIQYSEVPSPNDRTALVMLKYKRNKSLIDRYRLWRLKCRYPDNQVYEKAIVSEMRNPDLHFIDTTTKLTGEYIDRYGAVKQEWHHIPHGEYTTPEGIRAIRRYLKDSETGGSDFDTLFKWVQFFGILIAAAGGVLQIIHTLSC